MTIIPDAFSHHQHRIGGVMSLPLQVEEIIETLAELGGEADWADIKKQVTAKRENSFAPYRNRMNFETTMFQLLQQHCDGYKKFRGKIHFIQVRPGRFSLSESSNPHVRRINIPAELIHPETVPSDREYITGSVTQVLVNAYERDPKARLECIKTLGVNCEVCGMNFEQRYGNIGRGFIHVHHKKQLSSREVYHLNPRTDLAPVCPNCHAMLHTSYPPLEIRELQEILKRLAQEQNPKQRAE
jgi:predicted HNH restriction endonuclease